jgi:hypothetical protein
MCGAGCASLGSPDCSEHQLLFASTCHTSTQVACLPACLPAKGMQTLLFGQPQRHIQHNHALKGQLRMPAALCSTQGMPPHHPNTTTVHSNNYDKPQCWPARTAGCRPVAPSPGVLLHKDVTESAAMRDLHESA